MSDAFERAAERASTWVSLAMILATLGTLQSGDTRPFAMIGAFALTALMVKLRRIEPPARYLPTVVTLLRMAATFGLAFGGPALTGPVQASWVLALFCADGLDGWLARELDATSRLGARLDMESDAFLVLTVCTLHAVSGRFGAWILSAGLLRYGYALVVYAFSPRGEVPRAWWIRYSFGTSLTALTIAMLPIGPLAQVFALAGTAILCASFGRSLYWSFRGPTHA